MHNLKDINSGFCKTKRILGLRKKTEKGMLYFVYYCVKLAAGSQTIAKFCVLLFVVNGDNFCYFND